MDDILKTEKLCVGYGRKIVVQGVELGVGPGRILTLIGPNGSGKSTILKTVTRALRPIAGAVYLDGKSLHTLPELESAKRLSILMTARPAPELTTCRDVVSAGRYPYTGKLGILSRRDRTEVDRALALAGVAHLAEQDFTRVSDGERQLVMLARAVCQRPRVLVLDEPTSFLDVRHKMALLSILKDLAHRERLAVVMSLHELDLAEKISDTVVCVNGGGIDRAGPPEEIFTGGYIERLYGIQRGGWNDLFASPELEKPAGEPKVFVLGGGGRGVPFYRALQRAGVPFSAGILFENDIDFAAASPLGSGLIVCPAFTPITQAYVARAKAAIDQSEAVVDCACPLGELNRANGELLPYARAAGKRIISGLSQLREAFL